MGDRNFCEYPYINWISHKALVWFLLLFSLSYWLLTAIFKLFIFKVMIDISKLSFLIFVTIFYLLNLFCLLSFAVFCDHILHNSNLFFFSWCNFYNQFKKLFWASRAMLLYVVPASYTDSSLCPQCFMSNSVSC